MQTTEYLIYSMGKNTMLIT